MSLHWSAPEQMLFEVHKYSEYLEYTYVPFLCINLRKPSNETITELLTLLMEMCLR